MDEPFTSLDLKLKKEVSELFLQIQSESRRTALFVTHDVDEALTLGHRIIAINGGETVLDVLTCGADKDELRKQLISVLIA